MRLFLTDRQMGGFGRQWLLRWVSKKSDTSERLKCFRQRDHKTTKTIFERHFVQKQNGFLEFYQEIISMTLLSFLIRASVSNLGRKYWGWSRVETGWLHQPRCSIGVSSIMKGGETNSNLNGILIQNVKINQTLLYILSGVLTIFPSYRLWE